MKWFGIVALLCCAQPQDASSTSQPLRISVIGGSGMIGQRVVREALDRGHDVTMIVRDPDPHPALSRKRERGRAFTRAI
jgi:nucleoside-diphosphate-sugar epimerase